MIIKETKLKGCFLITPKVISDERGYFFESFNLKIFHKETGLKPSFVQDNQSKSSKGVLRGLHFQIEDFEQAKLVRVIKGSVLDVAVDLRKNSKTFGEYFSVILDDKSHQQLYIPRGFAHGFLVLEDQTIFSYKCDNFYNNQLERGIAYNDEYLNIDWGTDAVNLKLSEKDQKLPSLKTYLND